MTPNPDQEDTDGDGYGDACDPDIDGDGITNMEETTGWAITLYSCIGGIIDSFHVTSDPYLVDTDGDGLTDLEEKEGWNVKYRLENPDKPPRWIWIEYPTTSDPRNADIDSDGLNDWHERVHKTDPNRANTDCDGAWDTNDGFEVENELNPVDFDTDDDGLTDGEEIDLWIQKLGYSPEDPQNVPQEILDIAVTYTKIPDADGDGILDSEDRCPLVDSTGFDADHDGCIDTTEGLKAIIESIDMHESIQNSLISKIESAEKQFDKENFKAGINKLEAVINEIEAQRGKKIPEDTAELLIRYTKNIIAFYEAF